MRGINQVQTSTEAFCAQETHCCTAKKRKDFINNHLLFIADDGRVYALVTAYVQGERVSFYMDAITGSLYSMDGYCQSNDLVHMTGFRFADEEAAKILMKHKFDKTEKDGD